MIPHLKISTRCNANRPSQGLHYPLEQTDVKSNMKNITRLKPVLQSHYPLLLHFLGLIYNYEVISEDAALDPSGQSFVFPNVEGFPFKKWLL